MNAEKVSMSHSELYYRLVKEENLAELSRVVGEFLPSIDYELVTVEIRREEGFPYIYCQVVTEELFSAVMIGFFPDISSLIPEYKQPRYYLPIVAFCEEYEPHISRLIDKRLSIAHEVQHVKDMLELIRQYPDFPEKSYRYGFNSISTVDELHESIDFEMFKLFHIEPAAMRHDYHAGDHSFLIALDGEGKEVVRYECDSMSEYVGMKINTYMLRLTGAYEEKFAAEDNISKRIEVEMNLALARYGKDIFGPDPVKGLDKFKRQYGMKFFLTMAKRQFV